MVPVAKGGLIGKMKIEQSSAFKVYRGFDTQRKSHRENPSHASSRRVYLIGCGVEKAFPRPRTGPNTPHDCGNVETLRCETGSATRGTPK